MVDRHACGFVDIIKHVYEDEEENIRKLVSWLQRPPNYTTYRINVLKTNVDEVITILNEYFNRVLPEGEKPKVYGLFSDTVVIESFPEPNFNTVEENYPEVVVDAACGAAVLRGSHVFAPGIMALPQNVSLDEIVYVHADISGTCKKGLKVKFDDDKKIIVGKGRLKMPRYALFGENIISRGIAIEMLESASGVPIIDHDIFKTGFCLLQNLPSIICSKVLNPQPGELILDMCSAPGNKTSHIAELMNDKGYVVALEKVPSKLSSLKMRFQEHGITCVYPFTFDSTKCVDENADMQENIEELLKKGPPYPPNLFDRVLLDGPCSGLGRRPLLKCTMSTKMIDSYAPLQKKLFRAAVRSLRSGGILVYSTCTIAENECEKLIAWALQNFTELKLITAEPVHGRPGKRFCGLDDFSRAKVQRFGPSEDLQEDETVFNDTSAFFIARFEKD